MILLVPPSFVNALLRFVASENEPLAGDLAEEWQAGRSGRWFWSQLLRALVVVAWRKRRATPLVVRLVTTTPFDRPDRALGLIDPATINLSGIKVRGVGGLGLLSLIMLVTIALPQAWFLVLAGMVGGGVLGAALVFRRRGRGLSGTDGSQPLTLFGASKDDHGTPRSVEGDRPGVTSFVAVSPIHA